MQLAELLQAPVVDQGGRMNIPTTHYLIRTRRRSLIRNADLIVGLELHDFWAPSTVHRQRR